MYTYRARALNVVDGDTCDLLIDVGFHMTTTQRIRLLGVNTPEMRVPEQTNREKAMAAKSFTAATLGMDRPLEQRPALLISTEKDDAFGRWLANIEVLDDVGTKVSCLNDDLIKFGHAVPYKRK